MIKIDDIMGSSDEFNMQERIFNIILFLGILISIISSSTNIITGMPFYNYFFPIISGIFCIGVYLLSRKFTKTNIARIIFIFYLGFVYAPLGWLTTAGSLSAFVYYSILFLMITFLLIQKPWEYIFPILYLPLIIFLMYLETKYPSHFDVYLSDFERFKDISVHYVIVTLIMSAAIVILKYKYNVEHLKYIKLSTTDELTGLYNRRFVIQKLKWQYKKSKQNKEDFCIIMIDVDNFKVVNDVYGHLSGDDVLVKLANILMANSRSSDICGRYGGDEFIVILPNCTTESATIYSDRVKDAFDEYAKIFEGSGLSVSIGVADNSFSSENEIIKKADINLYKNKNTKKRKEV